MPLQHRFAFLCSGIRHRQRQRDRQCRATAQHRPNPPNPDPYQQIENALTGRHRRLEGVEAPRQLANRVKKRLT